MPNELSSREQARREAKAAQERAEQQRHADELEALSARLKQSVERAEKRIESLNTELDQIPAPDEADARSRFWESVLILVFALAMGVGFVFLAELSLREIGFAQWEEWKRYFAASVFWLGTVVTMHIYLSWLGRTGFSSLPGLIGWFPFFLIVLGVFGLALGRGLLSLLPGSMATVTWLELLVWVARWTGLSAQVVLSLGLDLGSGVLGFVGVQKYRVIQPIWARYREIAWLSNHRGTWGAQIATAELQLKRMGRIAPGVISGDGAAAAEGGEPALR